MRVDATVRGTGQRYADGVEALTIDISKHLAADFCCPEHGPKEIRLVIDGTEYQAVLRTTARMPVIYVTRRLKAPTGEQARLADVLSESGFTKNQSVVLQSSAGAWRIVV
jgi:hypothetical protein